MEITMPKELKVGQDFEVGKSSVALVDMKPDLAMEFNKDGEVIGRLDWNTGNFIFTGNVEESAKIFFDYLAMHSAIPVDIRKQETK